MFFRQIDLTKGKIWKNILIFTLPFFVTNFLNSMYSAIDLMFIGQFSDVIGQAAVANGSTIMFAINSVILGLATGGTIVIGQYFGSKSKDISKVTKNLILYMGIVGLIILVLMLILYAPICRWMQLSPEVIEEARTYLLILVLGIPFYVVYATISGIYRGVGNSFGPFLFFAIAVGSNIGLDALFVCGLNMGSTGAAIATVIGEALGCVASIIYLIIVKLPYKFEFNFKLEGKMCREIFRCGFPVAVQDGLVILSFAVILAAISTRGEVFTATVGVTDRITSFCFAPLSAIGSAVSTATAQNMGAGKLDRVKKYMFAGLVLALITGLIFGLLCQFIPRQLASIFTNDEQVIELTTPYIMSTSLDAFVCIFVFPINAIFIGSGHTVFAMNQNLAVTFLIRIPLALIFCLGLNSEMYIIGLAYPISTIGSLILCIIFYLSGRWTRLRSLTLDIEGKDEM